MIHTFALNLSGYMEIKPLLVGENELCVCISCKLK
jgi:hypothetical protein